MSNNDRGNINSNSALLVDVRTSDYDKDRLKLQDIRRRQRSGELPMVDHKTRMAFNCKTKRME